MDTLIDVSALFEAVESAARRRDMKALLYLGGSCDALHRLIQQRVQELCSAQAKERVMEEVPTCREEGLTMYEAAKILGVSEDTAREMGHAGKFETYRVGTRSIRAVRSSVERYMRSRR